MRPVILDPEEKVWVEQSQSHQPSKSMTICWVFPIRWDVTIQKSLKGMGGSVLGLGSSESIQSIFSCSHLVWSHNIQTPTRGSSECRIDYNGTYTSTWSIKQNPCNAQYQNIVHKIGDSQADGHSIRCTRATLIEELDQNLHQINTMLPFGWCHLIEKLFWSFHLRYLMRELKSMKHLQMLEIYSTSLQSLAMCSFAQKRLPLSSANHSFLYTCVWLLALVLVNLSHQFEFV